MLPTEDQEQMALVQWLELKGYKFTAIPNSTYTKSWKQKVHNKQMGLRAGLPDLFIIANNVPIFIELKRVKGGVVSASQLEWIKAIEAAGVAVKVCKGASSAIKFIEERIAV